MESQKSIFGLRVRGGHQPAASELRQPASAFPQAMKSPGVGPAPPGTGADQREGHDHGGNSRRLTALMIASACSGGSAAQFDRSASAVPHVRSA